MANFAAVRASQYDNVQRREWYRTQYAGLTAFERHNKLLRDYDYTSGSQQQQRPPPSGSAEALAVSAGVPLAIAHTRTDADALREGYRFLRTEQDDAEAVAAGLRGRWDAQLARKYYDRLFKEYCIADLSRYKEQKLGLRWRTRAEVMAGKGQFVCGAKGCEARQGLASYEVNFAYQEAGQAKQALVKLRMCPRCAQKLNHGRDAPYERARRRRGDREADRDDAAATGAGGDEEEGRRQRSSRKGRKRSRCECMEERKHRRSDSSSSSDASDTEEASGRQRRRLNGGSPHGGGNRRSSNAAGGQRVPDREQPSYGDGRHEAPPAPGAGGAESDEEFERWLQDILV